MTPIARERCVIAVSLATLFVGRSWAALQRLIAVDASAPATLALFEAALFSVALLASVLFALRWAAERIGGRAIPVAHAAALLVLITPIEVIDSHIRPVAVRWVSELGYLIFLDLLLVIPITGAAFLALGNDRLYRALRGLVLVLSPLVLIFAASAGWRIVSNRSHPIQIAGPVSAAGTQRVVWVTFDEFDFHAAFGARPASIEMPAFDRLRAESFFASRATSPAGNTMESMSSYLIGRQVEKFEGDGPRFDARLQSGQTVSLRDQPTVLSEARRLSVDTLLAGWWLPYCAAFHDQLSVCEQVSAASIRPAGWVESLLTQWQFIVEEHWLLTRFTPAGRDRVAWAEFKRDQYFGYEFIMERALPMVSQPGGRLVFLHFPIPHPLGIYDRRTNELTLTGASNSLDNLELVDRTLAELRRAMEAAGVWNSTTLIISADHALRPGNWQPFATWTPEERILLARRREALIPCLIKLAGSTAPLAWDKPFNTVALPYLVLAVLRGEVHSVEGIPAFLDPPGDGLGGSKRTP